MKKLKKHILDFNPAWEYVKEELEDVNTLSNVLLRSLNFEQGHFFTLLPSNANIEKIYNFRWGGILPPNPIEEYFVNGNKAYYSIKNSINDDLIKLILNEIKTRKQLSCIIDKVTGTASVECFTTFFDAHPVFNEKEVYFLLGKDNASIEVISKCLRASTSFWHSLCIFATADLKDISKELNFEQINKICFRTELIMVGAYDGEGYVFWEKNPKENKLFFSNNTIPIPVCS